MSIIIDSPEELKIRLNTKRVVRTIRKFKPDFDSSKIDEALSAINFNEFEATEYGVYENFLLRKNDVLQGEILALKAMDNLQRELGEGEYTVFRPFEYVLINPHNHTVNAIAYLNIEPWESAKVKFKNVVTDEKNNKYQSQKIINSLGTFLLCNVTLQANEKKVLTVGDSCSTFKTIFGCISKLLKKQTLLPSPAQMSLIKSFGINVATEENNFKKIFQTQIKKISCVFFGEIGTSFQITYENTYAGIKKAIAYFTFYKNHSSVDISFEIAKDISKIKESISIDVNNFSIANEKCLFDLSNDYHMLLANEKGEKFLLTSYDTNAIDVNDSVISYGIYDTLEQKDFVIGNSFLTETRFKLSSLSTQEIESEMAYNDIGILTLRR